MPRGKKPSVSYWESRGGYGSTITGTQHILAKGEQVILPEDVPTDRKPV